MFRTFVDIIINYRFWTFIFILIIVHISCTYQAPITKWEDGIIPYYLSGEFSTQDLDNISEAMRSWEGVCGVKFEKVTPRSSAYEIMRVSQNVWFSTIGENNSECYMLFHGNVGEDIDVIIHELGHCLGLAHEHQRPDRDIYVTIVWDNILPAKKYNFDIIDNPLIDEEDYEYDYGSVMHYTPVSFSIDGSETIIPKDEDAVVERNGISYIDAERARAIYGPPFQD